MITISGRRVPVSEWRAAPHVAADHIGWRRLAAAILLKGAVDARRDPAALAWLSSTQACQLAGALGLVDWPPRREHLAGYVELRRRARGD